MARVALTAPMTQGSLTERITRSLAYMLRHRPEEFDLDLDGRGAGAIGEVVEALCDRLGEDIEEDDVHEALDAGGRSRYAIEDGRIRALYGHSFSVDPGDSTDPPEFLYLGVGSRDAGRAEEDGLRGGRRAFLHLALTYEEAQEMGRRAAPQYAVIKVHAAKAAENGSKFYDREALYLAEDIAVDFIEVGEVHEDGIRRESRGRGPRRGRSGRDERGPRQRGGGTRVGGARIRATQESSAASADNDSDSRAEPAVQDSAQARPAAAPSGFGEGLAGSSSSKPSRATKPEPEPAPVQESAPQPEESNEGGSGFGAGIL